MVVSVAERDQVVEIGGPAVFPLGDVMCLAPVDGAVAVGPSAGGVDGFECNPLAVGGGAVGSADVDGFAFGIEDNFADECVAAKPTDGFVGEGFAVECFAGGVFVWAVEEGVCVDDDGDPGSTSSSVSCINEFGESVGVELFSFGDGFTGAGGSAGHGGCLAGDGVADDFVEFGVEIAADVAHAVPGFPE